MRREERADGCREQLVIIRLDLQYTTRTEAGRKLNCGVSGTTGSALKNNEKSRFSAPRETAGTSTNYGAPSTGYLSSR